MSGVSGANFRFKNRVIILLLCIGFNLLPAQKTDVKYLEKEVEQLSFESRQTEQELDRQEQHLDILLKQIDILKRTEESEESIKAVMALALSVSKKIERLKSRRDSLYDKSEQDKEVLRRYYTQKIDSLRQLMDKESEDFRKKTLQKKILALYDKQIRCMPRFSFIHFDPQALPPTPHDSLGLVLRADYLTLSLAEVDSQLQEVVSAEKTVSRQQKLSAKAELFLDDVNEGLFFGLQDQLAQANMSPQDRTGQSYHTDGSGALLTSGQLNNRIVTLNRLYDDLIASGTSAADNPLQREKIEQYRKLLGQIKEYLLFYRRFILEKLQD